MPEDILQNGIGNNDTHKRTDLARHTARGGAYEQQFVVPKSV